MAWHASVGLGHRVKVAWAWMHGKMLGRWAGSMTDVNNVSFAASAIFFFLFDASPKSANFEAIIYELPSDNNRRRSSEEILVLCRSLLFRTRLSRSYLRI